MAIHWRSRLKHQTITDTDSEKSITNLTYQSFKCVMTAATELCLKKLDNKETLMHFLILLVRRILLNLLSEITHVRCLRIAFTGLGADNDYQGSDKIFMFW